MQRADVDVLVVGAGPAGLSMACGLRGYGVKVRVIDQARGPSRTSRANILHARGVEVLERLGALGDLPERSLTAITLTQYLDGKPAVTLRYGDQGLGSARPAMYVSQADLEANLRHRLAQLDVEIEWGSTLTDLDQNELGVTAVLKEAEELRCRWLVGCDGAHSAVRKLAGIGFPGTRLTERFLLADVHADWQVDRTGGHGWPHAEGACYAIPMRELGQHDDLWRLMAYDPNGVDPKGEEQILQRFRELLPERTGRTDIVIRDAVWASTFRVHRRLADTYRSGRVLLAGDAAHVHSPLGGQGMVTGMGDAENLAWKLALVVRGRATDRLLDTYQAERRPLATEVLRGTTAATQLQVGTGPLPRFLRRRVLIPLANAPLLQRRASMLASQLWVHYRRGPLAGGIGAWVGRRPRPGDRIPDLGCTRPDGSVTRLHAELGPRWVLLASDGGELFSALRDRLGDDLVCWLRPQHSEPGADALLVRPDAHLAWRGKTTEPTSTVRWLSRWSERSAKLSTRS